MLTSHTQASLAEWSAKIRSKSQVCAHKPGNIGNKQKGIDT